MHHFYKWRPSPDYQLFASSTACTSRANANTDTAQGCWVLNSYGPINSAVFSQSRPTVHWRKGRHSLKACACASIYRDLKETFVESKIPFFTQFCWALIKEAFPPFSAIWAVGLQPLLAQRTISLVRRLIRKDSHCSPASWKARTKAAAGRLQFCLNCRGSRVKEKEKLLNRKAFWCRERN